jgi:hypothetical protein
MHASPRLMIPHVHLFSVFCAVVSFKMDAWKENLQTVLANVDRELVLHYLQQTYIEVCLHACPP